MRKKISMAIMFYIYVLFIQYVFVRNGAVIYLEYKNKAMICLSVIKSCKSASVVFLLCKFLMGLLLPFTAYAYQRLVDNIIIAYDSKSGMGFFITSLLFVILIYIFQAVEEPVENYAAFLIRQRINYLFDKQIAKFKQ